MPPATNQLWRIPKDGTAPAAIAADLGGQIVALTVDATSVYWAVDNQAMAPSPTTLYWMGTP